MKISVNTNYRPGVEAFFIPGYFALSEKKVSLQTKDLFKYYVKHSNTTL